MDDANVSTPRAPAPPREAGAGGGGGARARIAAARALAAELRRRHVFRVALAYAAAAWVVIQVSVALLPALHLPGWSVTLIAVLSILGFPVALILAWAFELTPEGVRRTEAPAAASPAVPGGAGAAHRAAELPGLPAPPPAIAGTPAPRHAPDLRSVAALPFADHGAAGEHRYLADGVTEELINGLARVPGLHVVSRTSAFALRDAGLDVREVGARLGVGSVVEGSVRVAGDRLRMTVQLVNAADGYTIWSATYDRRLEDVFAVQEEVARSIVAALRTELAGSGVPSLPEDDGAPLLPGSTGDFEAYSSYLRGRARWNERTPESLRRAIAHFRRATEADPGYARAYAGLADCYAILMDYGLVAPAEGLPPARAAAERALRLGPELAESHTSAALVRQIELDLTGAEAEFRAALALNPGYSVARHRYALLLAWLGRTDEARREIGRARRLDPLSPAIAATLGWIEYYAGDFEAAVREERATLAEHPGLATARVAHALALVALGRGADAAAELERAAEHADEGGSALALLAFARGRAGDRAGARRAAERLRAAAARGYVSPYYLAVAALGSGDEAEAIAALEAAAAEGSPQLVYLGAEPLFASFRSHPRVRGLLDRLRPAGPPPGRHVPADAAQPIVPPQRQEVPHGTA